MICPRCNTYYPDGLYRCPECHIELLEDIESEMLDETIQDILASWVLVYTTNTLLEAEMLQANLESAGIPTHIHSQVDSSRQLTVGALAIVKVFVRSTDVDDARAIIKDIENRHRRGH